MQKRSLELLTMRPGPTALPANLGACGYMRLFGAWCVTFFLRFSPRRHESNPDATFKDPTEAKVKVVALFATMEEERRASEASHPGRDKIGPWKSCS